MKKRTDRFVLSFGQRGSMVYGAGGMARPMIKPSFPKGQYVFIKQSWVGCGSEVLVVGETFFYDNWWTPVLFEDCENPCLVKSAALEAKNGSKK